MPTSKFKIGLPSKMIFTVIACLEIYSGICSGSNSENLNIAAEQNKRVLKNMKYNDSSDFFKHLNFNEKVIQKAIGRNVKTELRKRRFVGLYPGAQKTFPNPERYFEPNRNRGSNIESRRNTARGINSLYFNGQNEFPSEKSYFLFRNENMFPKDVYQSRKIPRNDLGFREMERTYPWEKASDGFKSNRYLKHAYYRPQRGYAKHFPVLEKYRKLRSFRYPVVTYKYSSGNNVDQEKEIHRVREINAINGHSRMPLVPTEEKNHSKVIKAKTKNEKPAIKNGDSFVKFKSSEESSKLSVSKKSFTVRTTTLQSFGKNKDDDFIRVKIFGDFSKNDMLERRKKESKIKKNSTENGRSSKNKRSKREQTLFIIMALFGLTAIILSIACIALIITRQRSKDKKAKRSKPLNDDKQEKGYADIASLASSQSSSGSVRKCSMSKTQNLSSSGAAIIRRKKSNYKSVNSSGSDTTSSDEEFYLEDSESELDIEQTNDRSGMARKNQSLPISVNKNYNVTKRKSLKDIDPPLEENLENIIIDKTDFNQDYEEASDDERAEKYFESVSPIESCKPTCNKSEVTRVKDIQSEVSFLNIALYENTPAFKNLDSYEEGCVTKDIQEKGVNRVQESEKQSACPIEHTTSYFKEKVTKVIDRTELKELQENDDLERKETNLGHVEGNREAESSNNSKASEIIPFPPKELSSNESRSSSTSKNKSENRIGSPWSRALANVKPRIISENQYGTLVTSSRVIQKENGTQQNSRGEMGSSNETFLKSKVFTHQKVNMEPSKKHPWSHLVDNTKTVFDSKMNTVIISGFGT